MGILRPREHFHQVLILAILLFTTMQGVILPVAKAEDSLATSLKALDPNCLTEDQRKEAEGMIERDLRRRREEANARDRAHWAGISDRKTWEAYRDERLERLRNSLAKWPEPPEKVRVEVTGKFEGDGFVIKNLVYESRPGNWVPGNLYLPTERLESMPGLTITHAHHQGKEQGELQDMGMTWARAGCAVLVIDQVGYGERRAHPFHSADDFDGDFKVGRQDYYYRYDSGIQLGLLGDSLMGWMVWDQMRAIDLLIDHAGADPEKIIMLGGVAGGGDPCGITAALDSRVAAAVPFNFGGPQPETVYPLPDDAEVSFNYMMGSYWDSTRGLYRTGAEEYFHWLITSSIAPRRLIHGHEFAWDGERDPVWKRYRKIYGEFYDVPDNLAVAHGKGLLRQRPPEASHCGQIGRYHRQMIHPVFERWFGIKAEEYSKRLEKGELQCLPPEARERLQPVHFNKLISEMAEERIKGFRDDLEKLHQVRWPGRMRLLWKRNLGEIEPSAPAKLISSEVGETEVPGASVTRVVLEVEPDVVVPVILFSPTGEDKELPIVIAVAQSGKAGFLSDRSEMIADLIRGGAMVCIPDLRGCGESGAGSSRGRTSGDTNRSTNMQMHDQTLLGQRLRDLRSVIAWVRTGKQTDSDRISIWGDNLIPPNPADEDLEIPHAVNRPHGPEPLGGLLAMLTALFDEGIERVYTRGSLISFKSVLTEPHVYVPHDVAVKNALTSGDVCDLAAMRSPRLLRCDQLVDSFGRIVTNEDAVQAYRPTTRAYKLLRSGENFEIDGDSKPASWLLGD